MWGTFILDQYAWDDRKDMADALEDIVSPRDTYGFASGGVYFYWGVDPRQILYIGRAVDLPQRFRQHHGLAGAPRESTKRKKIEAHLKENGEIGFSLLVRSPNSQTWTAALAQQLQEDFGKLSVEIEDLVDEGAWRETEKEIAEAEGIAIQSCLLQHGALPPWNEVAGELGYWGKGMKQADDSGAMAMGLTDSLLQARRSLRELSAEPTPTQFEIVLHTARIHAARDSILGNVQLCDFDILHALESLWWIDADDRERIRSDRYVLETAWPVLGRLSDEVRAQREAWCDGNEVPPSQAPPPLR